MAPTRSDQEIGLSIIDQKDPRPFNDRIVPDIVHHPKADVDRDQIAKPVDGTSSDSDSTVTDLSDQFDWDAEEDAKSAHIAASIKAKRGRRVYQAFLKLPRLFRVLLVGILGAGVLITPLIVVTFRFSDSPVKSHAYVWSLWLTIAWAAGIATYIIVDAIPHLVLVILRVAGYKIERMRVTIELIAAIRGWLKLALDVAWLWISLSVIRALLNPPGSYWTIVNRVVQALFALAMLVLVEKIFLRYVAINFHRKALADRIAENQLGLRALDRLSNAQPTPKKQPYNGKKGHRSRGSSLDMLGMANGNGEKGTGSASGSRAVSPTEAKEQQKRRSKKARRNMVAAVIVDQLGGALEQVTQDQFGSLASAGKLARKLFSTLSDVHPARKYLIVDDFYPYFPTTADAHAAFALFDKDGNGDISKKEMREAVRRIYRERKALTASLKDVGSAVAKLDAVMLGAVFLIFIFIALLIFNRTNSIASLVPLATIIVGFSFIFGNSAAQLFQSLIFIFSTHVFDVGDLVVIDDQPLVVREFGLFATTFRRVDGMEIVAPNSLLSSSKLVHNLRRSNSMWESTELMIAYDTPLELIEQLRTKLQAYVAANNREWSNCAVNIDKMEYQNAIFVIVAMEHRPNWQDWGGRWVRRNGFMRNLKTCLEELDIRYTNPLQPYIVPRGGSGSVPFLDVPPSPRSGSGGRRGSPQMSRETLGNAGFFEAGPMGRSPSRSLRPSGDMF
ncbi:Mechanosensitive ion channel-domain-containing protein [Epithele typhae]|uniref:Mechanosensitive ion channel-domain-containing protein n=1 Tax=Epithele typhae TaxID=378194 RepID=UPI002007F23D|nr:Mechanosensitive ion channel-domain-containing protein [Epithele typhae]KAH9935899.1 Mechanosensitive ion channel-domain-containing protein [Epithele typhae]